MTKGLNYLKLFEIYNNINNINKCVIKNDRYIDI